MKTPMRSLLLLLVLAVVAGCGSSPGPDSISSNKAPAAGAFPDCLACHSSQISPTLDPVVTNSTGTAGKHVAHVRDSGIPCIKCHFLYTDQSTHMNGAMDTSNPAIHLVNFDPAANPSGVWTKTTTPLSGVCSSLVCHGSDTLDWYGTGGASFHDCPSCHKYTVGTRRQVLSNAGVGGDFGGNPAITSHHVTGSIDPNRDQCLVCHDQSAHTKGAVRLWNADTGAGIAYNPAVPSSLETFCLSCHDSSGATFTKVSGGTALNPFNDGSTLGDPPYPYATKVAASWAKSYGHGPNGNHDPIKRLTCLGTGQPGTGCHGTNDGINGKINAHGSANQVLAVKPFKYEGSSTYVEADFKLCFDCHASYPTTRDTNGAVIYRGITKEDTFGVKQGGILDTDSGFIRGPHGYFPPYYTLGVTTHFADHNVPDLPPDYGRYTGSLYNDYGIWGPKNKNLHWSHLGFPAYLRGDINTESSLVCVNCHDVHGSSTPYGAVYDEMGYVNIDCSLFPGPGSEGCAGAGNEIMGKMKDEAYGSPILEIYPAYCAYNCHYPTQGVTKAWFYPIIE